MKHNYFWYPWVKRLSKTVCVTFLIIFFTFGLYLLHTVHSGGVSRGKVCGCGCLPLEVTHTRWNMKDNLWLFLFFEYSALWAESFYKVICPSVCVCVSVCVSVHFLSVPFKRPFIPTSQKPMSKKFRNSESLGKSNGKMGFQIWKLLFIKGVKLLRQKKFFSVQLFWYIFSQKIYFPMD